MGRPALSVQVRRERKDFSVLLAVRVQDVDQRDVAVRKLEVLFCDLRFGELLQARRVAHRLRDGSRLGRSEQGGAAAQRDAGGQRGAEPRGGSDGHLFELPVGLLAHRRGPTTRTCAAAVHERLRVAHVVDHDDRDAGQSHELREDVTVELHDLRVRVFALGKQHDLHVAALRERPERVGESREAFVANVREYA